MQYNSLTPPGTKNGSAQLKLAELPPVLSEPSIRRGGNDEGRAAAIGQFPTSQS
jgi:hypothetical protein